MTIGDRLEKLREDMGIKHKSEAARRLGLPYSTYANYETGKREPDSEMLIKLCEFYGVSMDYIMLGKTEKYKAAELTMEEDKLLALFRNSTEIGRGMALGILMSHQQEKEEGSKKGA